MPIVKSVLFVVVLACVAYTIWKALREFEQHQLVLSEIHWGWLAISGGAYLVGTAPSWIFWHRTLVALGQQPTWKESLRAFYISQLGKYVPGKAMVVVLRASWVKSDRVDATTAGAGVFVETLTAMAVGAFLAALILATWFHDQLWLVLLACGLMAAAGIPTLPPVFRKVVQFLQIRRASPLIDSALLGLNYRLMATGWVTIAVGWGFWGLSLMATLAALPGLHPQWEQLPLLIACVALAVVAGFLSLLPGGVGVRELVMIPLLAVAHVDHVYAVVAAVLLRLGWLLSEVIISIILYGWFHWERRRTGSHDPGLLSGE